MFRPATRVTRTGNRRLGAVTLELILMLPVWLIALFAVIEFGLLIANRQQVALASRVGAEEASTTGGLGATVDGDPVPTGVMEVIQQQLASSGITQCKVLLEHNIPGTDPPPVGLQSGTCDFTVNPTACTPPPVDYPAPDASNLPSTGRYVRVTVYVQVGQLTSNLLSAFGLDLSARIIRQSTTFRHEL